MQQALKNIDMTIAHLENNQKVLKHRLEQCDIDKTAFTKQIQDEKLFLLEMKRARLLVEMASLEDALETQNAALALMDKKQPPSTWQVTDAEALQDFARGHKPLGEV